MIAWEGQKIRAARGEYGRLTLVLGVLLLASSLGGTRSHASAIRSVNASTAWRQQARLLNRYEPYYARALASRSLRIEVPVGLRSLQSNSIGLLPQSAFVDYLRWRRSLNPARFDFYHPSVAWMITRDDLVRQTATRPPMVSPEVIVPGVVRPSVVTPPTVPEPSSAAIAGVILAAAWCARRWRRHQQGP